MLIFVRTPNWYAPDNYILSNAQHFPLCSWRSPAVWVYKMVVKRKDAKENARKGRPVIL